MSRTIHRDLEAPHRDLEGQLRSAGWHIKLNYLMGYDVTVQRFHLATRLGQGLRLHSRLKSQRILNTFSKILWTRSCISINDQQELRLHSRSQPQSIRLRHAVWRQSPIFQSLSTVTSSLIEIGVSVPVDSAHILKTLLMHVESFLKDFKQNRLVFLLQ